MSTDTNRMAVQNTLDTAAAAAANKLSLVGASGSVLAWLTSSSFGVLVGIIIGLAGLILNFYFKLRHDTREQAAHEAWLGYLKSNQRVEIAAAIDKLADKMPNQDPD